VSAVPGKGPKLRAVPSSPTSGDPVADAQVAVTRAVEQVTRARQALTEARGVAIKARERFDAGDQGVDVVGLAHQRELVESWERKLASAEEVEHRARLALLDLEKRRAAGEYEGKLAHVASWRTRLAPVLARLTALDEEKARIVDQAADIVADAQAAHAEACQLEDVVRPVLTMKTRGLDAPTMAEAKHMAQVHVARVRARAGRDELGDGWTTGLTQPDWKDAQRERWNAANKALDEMERGEAAKETAT